MKNAKYEIPLDGKVMACLDVSAYNHAVIDFAVWASRRLSADLICMHVLDHKTVRQTSADYSGSIGMDAGSHLLDELAELEARANRLAMQQGRAMLKEACARATAEGGQQAEAVQRHGPLAQALTEVEDQVRLFVLGKRGETADLDSDHLGANLERVVRSVHRPMLIVSSGFQSIDAFGIAYDGSPTARKCVDMVAMSPLLSGLTCHLIMAGNPAKPPEGLDWAVECLEQAGFSPQLQIKTGEAERVIAAQIDALDLDLLVMGAYGHSRIRHLIVGSTTTTILRNCKIPILLLR